MEVNVHMGIIAKINLKPSPYTLNILSCTKIDCENNAKELTSNFCPVCGGNVNNVEVIKYGVANWETFMDQRDWEGEDIFNTFPHGPEEVKGYEILTHYEWGNDELSLDAEMGNVVTIEELQEHKVKCLEKFNKKHGAFIKEMRDFFGNSFSYGYGLTSYWSG